MCRTAWTHTIARDSDHEQSCEARSAYHLPLLRRKRARCYQGPNRTRLASWQPLQNLLQNIKPQRPQKSRRNNLNFRRYRDRERLPWPIAWRGGRDRLHTKIYRQQVQLSGQTCSFADLDLVQYDHQTATEQIRSLWHSSGHLWRSGRFYPVWVYFSR